MRILSILYFAVVATCVSGCGPRAPGPSEDEYGRVIYWEVTGSRAVIGEACTDAQGWQEEIQPIAIDASSFIVYRVTRNGETAVTQSCATTEVESCRDAEGGATYTVDGSLLTFDPDPEQFAVQDSQCEFIADQLWTLEDRGEALTMTIVYDYGLEGEEVACATLEQNVRDASTNGFGLVGCTVTLTVDAEFHSVH